MGTFRNPARAEVRIRSDGSVVVATGTQDIGTGTLTIFPQIAADVLGLPADQVGLVMGDTRLPEAGPTYGSSSTMGVGAAVLRAAEDARAQLARLGHGPTIAEVMGRMGTREIVGSGAYDPAEHGKGF